MVNRPGLVTFNHPQLKTAVLAGLAFTIQVADTGRLKI